MRKNIVITVQYDGTRYSGWQKQGNTGSTVQGKLEEILSKMAGQAVEVHGSGRTDGGVHALGQVANFRLDTEMSAEEVMGYINRYLPKDIGVIAAREADMHFHSRLNAVRKTYRYRIRTGSVPDVFSHRYVWRHEESLDVEAMRRAAAMFVGEHDFRAFCGNRRMKKSTVRHIYGFDVAESGDEIVLEVTGNGFLYHMVRLMVGALVEVGEGKLPLEAVTEAAPRLAPAQGLCLVEVFY